MKFYNKVVQNPGRLLKDCPSKPKINEQFQSHEQKLTALTIQRQRTLNAQHTMPYRRKLDGQK